MTIALEIVQSYAKEVKRLKRALKALRIFGVSTRKDAIEAAARRKTVMELAPHCTDRELALFLHVSEITIRTDREEMDLPGKYASDLYHRRIPLIEPVRESFTVLPMPIIIPRPVYQEPVFAEWG